MREFGRTEIAKRTIEPIWQNSQFQLKITNDKPINRSLLGIELWDTDLDGKANQFLGCSSLKGNDLLHFCVHRETVRLDLEPSDKFSDKENCFARGEIQISGIIPAEISKSLTSNINKFSVETSKVFLLLSDLENRTLLSNVRCEVKFNDKYIGRFVVPTSADSKAFSEFGIHRLVLDFPKIYSIGGCCLEVQLIDNISEDKLFSLDIRGSKLKALLNASEGDWFNFNSIIDSNDSKEQRIKLKLASYIISKCYKIFVFGARNLSKLHNSTTNRLNLELFV
jgi:hypothetical protein